MKMPRPTGRGRTAGGVAAHDEPLTVYLSDAWPGPAWLRVDRWLGEWGIGWGQPGADQEVTAVVEARRRAEPDQEFKPLPRG